MKVLKKFVAAFLIISTLTLLGGFIYFNQKFTPEKNYLTVENESGPVRFKWLGLEKNVLLLPVNFPGDPQIYYLQFDTGSPYTLFYATAIKDIKGVFVNNDRAEASFYIGSTKISSTQFKIFNDKKEDDQNDSLQIIGTIGADILEGRKTLVSFKENHVEFNLSKEPAEFRAKLFDFKFTKRKVILPGVLKGTEEKFLFDSGTSAFELLTSKEVWENLKSPNSKIETERSQSWQNVLTTYTAACKHKISFNGSEISLNKVTYVEGFSHAQYALMKFSGMTGMLGNKIFLNHNLYIDCVQNKMGID